MRSIEEIRAALRRRGWQRRVVALSGVNPATVCRLATGRCVRPSLDVVMRVDAALDKLMAETEDRAGAGA